MANDFLNSFAVISDVHGNFPALKAVLADIDTRGIQRIISLGDVAGYYCMVNECVKALQDRGLINIMGNHDFYLLTGTSCPRSGSANDCLGVQRKVINRESLLWLSSSLKYFDQDGCSFRHGGWNDDLDEYVDNKKITELWEKPFKFFFSGHTHIQRSEKSTGKLYCNPGSVGQPRDGDSRAAYAIIQDGRVYLHRVEYDIEQIVQAMQACGLNDYYTAGLYTGQSIGCSV